MSFKSIREFITLLEDKGQLRRISTPVSADLEITEVTDRVSKQGGPALLFENVEGFDIPVESEGEVHALVLENQSQFVIQEIHVHADPSFASGSSLQIASNLEPQARWELNSFTSGDYITFVRERPDGRALSVTTAAPVYVDAPWYRVLLLDDAFRVLEPEQ